MPPAAERISSVLTFAFVAAGLAFGGWIGLWQAEGAASPLDRLEYLTLDWRFLLAGARSPPPGVIIVAIDDRTLAEIDGHAPSRPAFAHIVRSIAAFHPKAVALDVAFPDSKGEEVDAELADALKGTTSVVAAIGIFSERETGRPVEPSELALAPRPSEVMWPVEAIGEVAQAGLANVSTDASGIPRYVPMIFDTPDGVAQSFALAASAAGLGAEPVFAPGRIELVGRAIETDLGYHLPIRYYGPATDFPTYSAADVLSGKIDPAAIRGQIVVVGLTATGFGDTFATPFDRVAPGVEIFATAISNLLSGATLARTSSTRLVDAGADALLPAAMIAFIAMRRAAVGLALAALVFLLWTAGVFVAFRSGYWLSMASPLAAAIPLVVGYGGARLLVERQAGRTAAAGAAALAKFQSPLLIERILREPDFLKKPVRKEVAVLFLDLSGFTRAAEALGLEQSRDLLAEMQALAERELIAHDGVVINYMGDGVLAAFGLPTEKPDDASRALLAVEALWRSVGAWLKRMPMASGTQLDFRIGAHFGPVILSRLGSPTHQQITVTGDTVNVASRLLEVAKQQRRRLVVTEDLVNAASARSALSGLDVSAYVPLTVSIRGRASTLEVWVRD